MADTDALRSGSVRSGRVRSSAVQGAGEEGRASTQSQRDMDRENLNRLLNIFNSGTGVNLGTVLVRVIEAQRYYDSTQETEDERDVADIIMASIQGWKVRKNPKMRLRLEEGKEPVKPAKHGRSQVEASIPPRRVTINDTRQPPRVTPHMTQRVKTFYMDTFPDKATKRDTILIPQIQTKSARARTMIGGTPITRETAIELRMMTIGSTIHSFSMEWRKSSLLFHDISSKFAYGLQTVRCGSRTLVLCVQGYLLKHLLFQREYASSLQTKNAMQPTEFERRKALCGAICEILWQAGNQTRCCLCLQQETPIFDTDYRYRVDGITEKLHLYEFKKYVDLEMFVKRHLSHFEQENSNGCILLLYSLILSRTATRIHEEMDNVETDNSSRNNISKLLMDNEQCTPALLNLLLTGRAVPNIHNGNVIYDANGHLLPQPLRGVKERSQVGLLYWDRGENPDERTEVGSMLKTPKSPIWITIVNGQYGLLFSTNRDLVSDWRVEHHFTLFYYTGQSQHTATALTIETLRVPRNDLSAPAVMESTMHTRYNRKMRCKTGLTRKMEEEKIPALEQCILTKWYGATIDWNGVYPFF